MVIKDLLDLLKTSGIRRQRPSSPEVALSLEIGSTLRSLSLENKLNGIWFHVPNEISARNAPLFGALLKDCGKINGVADYIFMGTRQRGTPQCGTVGEAPVLGTVQTGTVQTGTVGTGTSGEPLRFCVEIKTKSRGVGTRGVGTGVPGAPPVGAPVPGTVQTGAQGNRSLTRMSNAQKLFEAWCQMFHIPYYICDSIPCLMDILEHEKFLNKD